MPFEQYWQYGSQAELSPSKPLKCLSQSLWAWVLAQKMHPWFPRFLHPLLSWHLTSSLTAWALIVTAAVCFSFPKSVRWSKLLIAVPYRVQPPDKTSYQSTICPPEHNNFCTFCQKLHHWQHKLLHFQIIEHLLQRKPSKFIHQFSTPFTKYLDFHPSNTENPFILEEFVIFKNTFFDGCKGSIILHTLTILTPVWGGVKLKVSRLK